MRKTMAKKKKQTREKNEQYWKDRAVVMEEGKEAQAERLSRRTAKTYRHAYHNLVSEIDALYAEILDKGLDNVTRTDIYNLNRYTIMANKIASEIEGLAKLDNKLLTELLESISFSTYKANFEALDIEFTILNEVEAAAIANQNWAGMKYSDRIWGNAADFNSRVMSDIESMVIGGKSPDQLKKKLMEDFTSKFYEADRLIRTEASHAYNSAALESYKKAGCQFIDYLAEADCCEICEPYSGQRFPIDDVPVIPVHPNCRCTYLPVVEV
jgi:SPP1 gp7 family putative phage head morphogenesis protein